MQATRINFLTIGLHGILYRAPSRVVYYIYMAFVVTCETLCHPYNLCTTRATFVQPVQPRAKFVKLEQPLHNMCNPSNLCATNICLILCNICVTPCNFCTICTGSLPVAHIFFKLLYRPSCRKL